MKSVNLDLLKEPISGDHLEEATAYFKSQAEGKPTSESLNGKWKFAYLQKMDSKYLEPGFDINALKDIKVPSQIELNGYAPLRYSNIDYDWEGQEDVKPWSLPKKNSVGIYFKDIRLKDISSKDIFLEINGFESAVYLYINGFYVGYSSNGFVTNRFRINPYLQSGINRIAILVFRYSISSWVTDQDMWRMTGLFRDVNLVSLPLSRIENITNRSKASHDYKTGFFDVSFHICEPKEKLTLSISLSYNGKEVFKEEHQADKEIIRIKKPVANAFLWSDEIPNLYVLHCELVQGKNVVHSADINIGFRKVEIKNGIILLNGKRLIIRGVNRHEFSCDTGRAITPALDENDIKLLKANNFNAIRCSHYPNINEFYDLCDKYGILVMDEAPIETHGTWQTASFPKGEDGTDYVLPGNDPKYMEYIVDRGRRMLKRDFNHPCIISWSLGNESFASSNLLALADYFRQSDDSRFVHYEGCHHGDGRWEKMSDVYSTMYFHPEAISKYLDKNTDKPYIQCEFEHSMGNSTGNFDEYMALIDKYPNYQGGFVWDFVDQGFRINGENFFGQDFPSYPNDGNFCADGLLLMDRKPTSKLDAVKYYYQPLSFDIYSDHVKITSRMLFKDTADYTFRLEFYKEGILMNKEDFRLSIKPGESLEYYYKNKYECPDPNASYYLQLRTLLYKDEPFGKKNYELMKEEKFIQGSYQKADFTYKKPDKGDIKVFRSVNHLTVQVNDFKVIFNGLGSGKGGLEAIYLGDKCYLHNLVLPTLYRPTTDNDMTTGKYYQSVYMGCSAYPIYNPIKDPIKIVSQDKYQAVIEVVYQMFIGIKFYPFKVTYTVSSDETIKVDYEFKRPLFMPAPNLVGLKFAFDKENEEFSYLGMGPKDNYIDRYKGQSYGLYASSAKEEYVPYSAPQECGNHCFTKRLMIKENSSQLEFIAIDKTFSFKYLPYSEMEMEFALSQKSLPQSSYNYLTIMSFNKGVGGDDSWGSPVHEAYTLKDKTSSLSFLIKIS